jgi:phage FluMu protein gp41
MRPLSLVVKHFTATPWAGGAIMQGMEQARTPTRAEATIGDLFSLTLVDGLPVEREGKTIRYKAVRLRETGVAHERRAIQQAERVMVVGGVPKLLVSEADFRFALTAQHIEWFECDGQRIPDAVIDLALVGKLSTHDLGLIEQRVFLINLAAEVRYGNLSQEEFDAVMAGGKPAEAPAAPQPVGQAADVGAMAAAPQPGPALLADFAGNPAAGAPAGNGR